MQPYLQTTSFTTAACGLMMIINHHDPQFELSKENEHRVWIATANLPVRASSIYALAALARERGLTPRIVLGEREYDYPDYRFKRYTKKEIDEAKFTSKLHAKRARELGVPIEERHFDLEEVKRLASAGHQLLLRVNAGVLREERSTSNYVVVYRYRERFSLIDPRQGRLILDEAILDEAFKTLQSKKKRDPRMIVF